MASLSEFTQGVQDFLPYWQAVLIHEPYPFAPGAAVVGWLINRRRSMLCRLTGSLLAGTLALPFVFFGGMGVDAPTLEARLSESLNAFLSLHSVLASMNFFDKILFILVMYFPLLASLGLYILARVFATSSVTLSIHHRREAKGLRRWRRAMRAYERSVRQVVELAETVPAAVPAKAAAPARLLQGELLPAPAAAAHPPAMAGVPSGFVLVPEGMTLAPIGRRLRPGGLLGKIVWFFDMQVAAVRGFLWVVRTAFYLAIPLGLVILWLFGGSILGWFEGWIGHEIQKFLPAFPHW